MDPELLAVSSKPAADDSVALRDRTISLRMRKDWRMRAIVVEPVGQTGSVSPGIGAGLNLG
jgi:hypothetical protein